MLTTRCSLLARMVEQADPLAWQRWLDVYEPWLRDWLKRQHFQPVDADDLLQNVLVVVNRKLPTFQHNGRPGAFRTWLRGILLNEARLFRRGRSRRPTEPLADDLDALEDPNSELTRQWDQEHDQQLLQRLLGVIQSDFHANTWELFRQHVLEDRPAAEVAQRCATTTNCVYVARSRVLARLRAEAAEIFL